MYFVAHEKKFFIGCCLSRKCIKLWQNSNQLKLILVDLFSELWQFFMSEALFFQHFFLAALTLSWLCLLQAELGLPFDFRLKVTRYLSILDTILDYDKRQNCEKSSLNNSK